MNINKIKNENFPKFILFKNLSFKESELDFNVSSIEKAEIISISDTPEQARIKIPKPSVPIDSTKKELFEHKVESFKDYTYNDSPYAIIDVDPSDIENTLDFDIFGESYTLLWVCPVDSEKTIKTLINHTINYAKDNNCQLSDVIGYVWEEYIDSISIATENPMFDTAEYVFNLKQEYQEKISNLLDAPKQKDWDSIDEMTLK